MPIQPPPDAVNAIFLVRRTDAWWDRLRACLSALSAGDALKVAMHLDLLERRGAGELSWVSELSRGRTSPTIAYNDMLEMGGQLPRYTSGPIHVTVDLYNPGNEAGEEPWNAELEAIELLAHTPELYPWSRGKLHDGTPVRPNDAAGYAKMGKLGEAFGALVAAWCETLAPVFAFADVKATGPFLSRAATAARAAGRPAPRYWDYLWPISCWSPELLAERPGLEQKLIALALSPDELGRVDAFERQGLKTTAKKLADGSLFVQYRTILGTEKPGSRSTVDAPLAARAGLQPLF